MHRDYPIPNTLKILPFRLSPRSRAHTYNPPTTVTFHREKPPLPAPKKKKSHPPIDREDKAPRSLSLSLGAIKSGKAASSLASIRFFFFVNPSPALSGALCARLHARSGLLFAGEALNLLSLSLWLASEGGCGAIHYVHLRRSTPRSRSTERVKLLENQLLVAFVYERPRQRERERETRVAVVSFG